MCYLTVFYNLGQNTDIYGCSNEMESIGLKLLQPKEATESITRVGAQCRLILARIMFSKFYRVNSSRVPWKFVEDLMAISDGSIGATSDGEKVMKEEVIEPSKRRVISDISYENILDCVQREMIDLLGEGQMDIRGRFAPEAFDSLSAVEFSNRVSKHFDVKLPGTLVYDYPSLESLSSFVHFKMNKTSIGTIDGIGQEDNRNQSLTVAPVCHKAPELCPVISLQVASRCSQDMDSKLSSVNADHISMVPFDRWNIENRALESETASVQIRFGGWLADIHAFDANLFNISASEGILMDPQQRLLLEVSWEVSHGCELRALDTGTYVGIQQMEYGVLLEHHRIPLSPYSATSASFSVAAGRIAFVFGFGGPAVSIDTACSSAMVAVHNAAQHVRNHRASALSSGINTMLVRRTTFAAQMAGMLSQDGRCKTLDAHADGYARAEACIVMLLSSDLKSSDDREATVVLKSTFINQDGRSTSLTAPNGPSQQRVILGGLAAASLARSLDALELHGTGTALGDPIEIGAICNVFGSSSASSTLPIRLGASKSRYGHAEPASGSIGTLHARHQITQCEAVQVLHLTKLNRLLEMIYVDMISEGKTAPYALRQHAPANNMNDIHEKVIGVSSFAFQGTNAFILLASHSIQTHVLQTTKRPLWQRKRYWFVGQYRKLIWKTWQTSHPTRTLVNFELPALGSPSLCYLMDHVIGNQALFPASAMLDASCSSVASALDQQQKNSVSLHRVIFSAAYVIESTSVSTLELVVDTLSGSLTLQSKIRNSSTIHMSALGHIEIDPWNGTRKQNGTLQHRMFDSFIKKAMRTLDFFVHRCHHLWGAQMPVLRPIGGLDSKKLMCEDQPGGYEAHPALLDSSTHLCGAFKGSVDKKAIYLPIQVAHCQLGGTWSRKPSSTGTFSCIADVKIQSNLISCHLSARHNSSSGSNLGEFMLKSIDVKSINPNYENHPVLSKRTEQLGTMRMPRTGRETRYQKIQSSVRDAVFQIIGKDVSSVQSLMDAGFDSLGLMELRSRLMKSLSLDLPATVGLDYPTIGSLSNFISEKTFEISLSLDDNLEMSLEQNEDIEHKKLTEKIRALVKDLIKDDVPDSQPLMEAGVDSLGALELRNKLSEVFQANLPQTLVFDYPTIQAVSNYIRDTISIKRVDEQITSPAVLSSLEICSTRSSVDANSTAIVASSSLFPSESNSSSTTGLSFESLPDYGLELVRPVPLERWDIEHHYHPNPNGTLMMYVRSGIFLRDIENFDAAAFRIEGSVARAMDPQQRLMLEQTSLTLMEAQRKTGRSIEGTDCGVHIGSMYQEFAQLQHENGVPINPQLVTGNGLTYLVGRVSYTFDLSGPSVGIDTACSSSLVAIHSAHTELLKGDSSVSLASGVNTMLLPVTTSSICTMGALSPDARCKTFDASADGYGRGEGLAVFLLTLCTEESLNGGLALVKCSGVNQDGRSSSLTAPNGPSQTSLIRESLRKSELSHESIRFISAHGTGTPLGDPVEINAHGTAMRNTLQQQSHFLSVGSVKTSYGHTEGAAGICGTLLAIESLRGNLQQQIMHLRVINPYVASSLSDFLQKGLLQHIPRENGPLINNSSFSFLAGTSSFGMGGTNAHSVLDTCPSEAHQQQERGDCFERHRLWPSPPQSHIINSAKRSATGQVKFQIGILKQTLKFLFDHQIFGKIILPATFMLETVLALAWNMLNPQILNTVICRNWASSNPAILSQKHESMMLEAELSMYTGEVNIFDWENQIMHTKCQLGRVGNGNTLPKATSPVSASLVISSFPEACPLEALGNISTVNVDSGFRVNPAVLDSSLHIGTFLMPIGRQVCLPVQASAFSYQHKDIMSRDNIFATCLSKNVIFGALLESAHRIKGSSFGYLTVEGLFAKPLAAGAQPQSSTSNFVFPRKREMMEEGLNVQQQEKFYYRLDSQASRASVLIRKNALDSSSTNISILREDHSRQSTMDIQKNKLSLCHSSSTILQVIQLLIMNLSVKVLSFETVDALTSTNIAPSGSNAGLKYLLGAVGLGLLRVASSEGINLIPEAMDADLATMPDFFGNSVGNDDVSGCRMQAGVIFRNLMIRSPVDSRNHSVSFCSLPTQRSQALITGGFGGIGSLVACWVQRIFPQCDLILLGRSGMFRDSHNELSRFFPPDFCAFSCDAARQEDISDVVDHGESQSPISLVFHAAGLLRDTILQRQNASTLRISMSPKLDFLEQWKAKSAGHPMKHFNAFSSISAFLGSRGQANYAAANAALDEWINRSRRRGLMCSTVQWGPWSGVGMAHTNESVIRRALDSGIGVIDPIEGLSILEAVLRFSENNTLNLIVSDFNFRRLLLGIDEYPLIFSEVLERQNDSRISYIAPYVSHHPQDSLALERRDGIEQIVRSAVLDLSGISTIDSDEPFMEAGIDSLSAMELRNEIARNLKISLPTTVIFDYPTVNSITSFIAAQGVVEPSSDISGSNHLIASSSKSKLQDGSCLVTGLSCRFPPNARGIEGFANSLQTQKDLAGIIPPLRWNADQEYIGPENAPQHGKIYVRFASTLDDIASFDPDVFGIKKAEVANIDPQQRILLEETREAFSQSGTISSPETGTAMLR